MKWFFIFRNVDIETDVELIQKIVGVVRSTRADYTIPNKTKTELYLEVHCSATRGTVSKYGSTVSTLAYCSDTQIGDKPPPGCAIVTINDKVLHIHYPLLILDLFIIKSNINSLKCALVNQYIYPCQYKNPFPQENCCEGQ